VEKNELAHDRLGDIGWRMNTFRRVVAYTEHILFCHRDKPMKKLDTDFDEYQGIVPQSSAAEKARLDSGEASLYSSKAPKKKGLQVKSEVQLRPCYHSCLKSRPKRTFFFPTAAATSLSLSL
jgi:hypothetical protein